MLVTTSVFKENNRTVTETSSHKESFQITDSVTNSKEKEHGSIKKSIDKYQLWMVINSYHVIIIQIDEQRTRIIN